MYIIYISLLLLLLFRFWVFGDFSNYQGGVYKRTSTKWTGAHAVKVIGWGVDEETGEKYWTIANSWGSSWGEDGFFRIARGVNECGIEDEIVAGIPDIKNVYKRV